MQRESYDLTQVKKVTVTLKNNSKATFILTPERILAYMDDDVSQEDGDTLFIAALHAFFEKDKYIRKSELGE